MGVLLSCRDVTLGRLFVFPYPFCTFPWRKEEVPTILVVRFPTIPTLPYRKEGLQPSPRPPPSPGRGLMDFEEIRLGICSGGLMDFEEIRLEICSGGLMDFEEIRLEICSGGLMDFEEIRLGICSGGAHGLRRDKTAGCNGNSTVKKKRRHDVTSLLL